MTIYECSEGIYAHKAYETHTDMFGTQYAVPTEGDFTRDELVSEILQRYQFVADDGKSVTVAGNTYALTDDLVDEFNRDGAVLLAVA